MLDKYLIECRTPDGQWLVAAMSNDKDYLLSFVPRWKRVFACVGWPIRFTTR